MTLFTLIGPLIVPIHILTHINLQGFQICVEFFLKATR